MVREKNSKLKNSIVLRGMASNVVDEAIVFLKPNVKGKVLENTNKVGLREKTFSKDLIMEEAENVINEYIAKIQRNSSLTKQKRLQSKLKILKITNIISAILLIILAIMNL